MSATMNPEIDVAAEFLCLSFIVWGARAAERSNAASALALEDNQ
jgi:hypothetical protein